MVFRQESGRFYPYWALDSVTKNEFENPPALPIRSYVNGELRQDSNTSLMINGVAKVISQLSQGMTLQAGTIIAMGTPAGVGRVLSPLNS